MQKQNKQRLEQLVRQGLVPSRKLPILMTAMSSLHMGKQLTPTERDILAKYMHNMTDIMLKDDTVFNRTKLHTQRTKYQTEETTVESDNVQELPEEEGKKYTSYQRAVTNAEKRKAEQKAKLKTTKRKPGLPDLRLGNTVGRTAAQTYATPSGMRRKAGKYHPGAPDAEAAKRRKAIEKHQAKKQEKDYWDDDTDYNDTAILEKMVDGVEVVDGPEAEEKMKSKKAKKKDDIDDMKESREGDEEERMRKKEENKARRLSIRKRDKFRMLPTELKKEKMKAGVEEEVLNFNDMYKEQFEAALEYYGIDNIRDLPEESKAEFFNLVDLALEEAKMAKKDHDGDGKVETSTAEYMGSKDKAIKKAMKKEEVEQVDELKKSTLSSYIQKAADPAGKKSNVNLASKGAHKLATSDDMDAGEKEDKKAFVRSRGIQTAAKKLAKEETERLDEYGNPASKPAMSDDDKLAMIRRAAERVKSGEAARDREKRAEKAAKADMRQKGAQKGMAPTKKDVEEQVKSIRKTIKEGSAKEKIEAYKELNTIIEQFKSTGEL